jgi:hypothetical protein
MNRFSHVRVGALRPRRPSRSRKDLRDGAVASLRRWITTERVAVVAGPLDGQAEAIRAVTAQRELRCRQLDLGSLATFRDDWFDELRG